MGYDKLVTLAERCAKYAQACGKRSILETKPVGKVDVSKLGVCLSDGTVRFPHLNMIRYRTAEEAEANAKKICMKQYETPIGQQKEIMIGTVGRDLYLNEIGTENKCQAPAVLMSKAYRNRPKKLFHNHPTCLDGGYSEPVSPFDIWHATDVNPISLTAFNSYGEYNTVKMTDKYFKLSQRDKLQIVYDLTGAEIKMQENIGQCTAEQLAIIQHKCNAEILPQYGIEYETNFSNLLKYDA